MQKSPNIKLVNKTGKTYMPAEELQKIRGGKAPQRNGGMLLMRVGLGR
jgi:hypothetical protein